MADWFCHLAVIGLVFTSLFLRDGPISSDRLLEEALRRSEVEFFPKLRRYVGNFIDLFNHDVTQAEVKHWVEETKNEIRNFQPKRRVDEVNEALNDVLQARSVFEIIRRIRFALDSMSRNIGEGLSVVGVSSTGSFIDDLFKTGLHTLLLDDNFSFLGEKEGTVKERAQKLVEYIKKNNKSLDVTDSLKAFNDYIESWKYQKRKQGWNQAQINVAVTEMENERRTANEENRAYVDSIISEISSQFEPLRKLLTPSEIVKGNPAMALVNGLLGESAARAAVNAAAFAGHRRLQPRWFDDTRAWLVDYINGKKTDEELKSFIILEGLEADEEHFKGAVFPWIRLTIERNNKLLDAVLKRLEVQHTAFILPKEPLLLEVQRMSKFIYAVVFNKPEMLKDHQDMLMEVVNASVSLPAPSGGLEYWIPCISFGQLLLPGGHLGRVVQLQFVLDQKQSHDEMMNVLRSIKDSFENVRKCELADERGFKIVRLEIDVSGNVATLVANTASKLSDMSIRGILVGNFGLAGFRHAMNPTFNRIYSLDAKDNAEGFIPTYYRGSIDRGGEPYFCPNGWRRFAIDVGMNGEEFERAYGSWPVAYHGTQGHVAMAILLTGLKASGEGCFRKPGHGVVYISPSIEYSGHPRYAGVWKVKNKFVQLILQVRIDRKLVFEKHPGTLPGAFPKDPPMDPNFKDNNELEWVISWPPGSTIKSTNGIVVYGLMMRVTDVHPWHLPQNKWWGSRATLEQFSPTDD